MYTEPCKQWPKGLCRRFETCKYYHEPLVIPPLRPGQCAWLKNGAKRCESKGTYSEKGELFCFDHTEAARLSVVSAKSLPLDGGDVFVGSKRNLPVLLAPERVTKRVSGKSRMVNPHEVGYCIGGAKKESIDKALRDHFAQPSLPFVVDIGSAQGRFIMHLAQLNEQKSDSSASNSESSTNYAYNYVGFELRSNLVAAANAAVATNATINGKIRFLQGDAKSHMIESLADVIQSLPSCSSTSPTTYPPHAEKTIAGSSVTVPSHMETSSSTYLAQQAPTDLLHPLEVGTLSVPQAAVLTAPTAIISTAASAKPAAAAGPAAVVEWITIQFPDPWTKKKHHNRRLVDPSFVTTCARLACHAQSKVYMCSDRYDLAVYMYDTFAASPLWTAVQGVQYTGCGGAAAAAAAGGGGGGGGSGSAAAGDAVVSEEKGDHNVTDHIPGAKEVERNGEKEEEREDDEEAGAGIASDVYREKDAGDMRFWLPQRPFPAGTERDAVAEKLNRPVHRAVFRRVL
jgi:tRNA G46 methylase TrmB